MKLLMVNKQNFGNNSILKDCKSCNDYYSGHSDHHHQIIGDNHDDNDERDNNF